MRFWLIIVMIGFVSGQVAALNSCCGVRIIPLDVAVVFFVIINVISGKISKEKLYTYLFIFGPFIVTSIISLFASLLVIPPFQVGISSLYLLRFVLYSLSVVLIKPSDSFLTIRLLWWTGVVIAVIGFVQYLLYPDLRNLWYLGWDPHKYRIFSTLFDPNFTGIILVQTMFLGYLMFQRMTGFGKYMVFSSLGVVFAALLFTYSRGAIISLVIPMVLWMIIKKKYLFIILSSVMLMLITLVLPKPGGEGVELFRIISIQSRIVDTQEGITLFRTSPFFGVGFNTLRFMRRDRGEAFGVPDHSVSGFHNSYIFILATTGIIGFLAYGWLWIQILFPLIGSYTHVNELEKLHLEVVFMSVGSLFIHALFDLSLFYPHVMFWTWCLIATASEKVIRYK